MKTFLKLVHTLSAIGLSAILITHLVILMYLPDPLLAEEYFASRELIAAISNEPLLIALTLVLVSGLFSIAFHAPFHNYGWVWAKAALGLLMFEWILIGVSGPAQKANTIINSPNFDMLVDKATLESLQNQEFGSLLVMLAIVTANVIIAVYRPRFTATK